MQHKATKGIRRMQAGLTGTALLNSRLKGSHLLISHILHLSSALFHGK